jgi:pilus assembly protein Flp/PilA
MEIRVMLLLFISTVCLVVSAYDIQPLLKSYVMKNLFLRATCFAQSFAAVAKDRRGVTAMEYGLIAALIALFIIGAVTDAGTAISGVFGKVATALNAA